MKEVRIHIMGPTNQGFYQQYTKGETENKGTMRGEN